MAWLPPVWRTAVGAGVGSTHIKRIGRFTVTSHTWSGTFNMEVKYETERDCERVRGILYIHVGILECIFFLPILFQKSGLFMYM